VHDAFFVATYGRHFVYKSRYLQLGKHILCNNYTTTEQSYKIIPDFISNIKHVSAKIQKFLNSQYVKNIYKIVKYKTIWWDIKHDQMKMHSKFKEEQSKFWNTWVLWMLSQNGYWIFW